MGTGDDDGGLERSVELALLLALGVVAAVIVSTLSTGLVVLYREQCGGSCMYSSDDGPTLRLAVVFLGNAAVLLTAGALGLRRWTRGHGIGGVVAGALAAIAILWVTGMVVGRM